MANNQQRSATLFHGKEILRGAGGLDDILSYVVDSSTVPENPVSSGRYVLEAGTVMAVDSGTLKVLPVTSTSYSAQDIVGICEDDHEFWITSDTTPNGGNADEAIGVLHMGCHFNIDNLVGYTGNESDVQAALPLCKFS